MAAVRGLRWWIIGLVFLATLINFIDRLTIAVLGPVITTDLGLTNTEFGSLTVWFLAAYTASQGLSGRLYDRVGTQARVHALGARVVGGRDRARVCAEPARSERPAIHPRPG